MSYILKRADGSIVAALQEQIAADVVADCFRSVTQVWLDPRPSEGGVVEFVQDAPAESPTQWLIDVGPFLDRFGAAKMAVLSSDNATVRALVTDLLSRKWIDLKRPDLADGIDALILLGISGVNASLKNSVLNTPVTELENLALRKLYFS